VVVCTGGTDPADADGLINLGVRRFFHKPVPMADLVASVEGIKH
jgi:hypothetical protein